MWRSFVLSGCILVILAPIALQAQVAPAWTARYDGGAGLSDFASALKLDSAGNAYVLGRSFTAAGGSDLATVAYGPSGNRIWAATNALPATTEVPAGLALDALGNVYIVGSVYETNNNVLTIKYNDAGQVQWVRQFDGGHYEFAYAMTADPAGNVYVAAVQTHGLGSSAYLVLKYSTGGDLLWARTYSVSPGNINVARDLAVDSAGNVYVTGTAFSGSATVAATLKYDSNGNTLWTAVDPVGIGLSFAGNPAGIVVNASGIYVCTTGYGSRAGDIVLFKYDASGAQQWVARHDGGRTEDAFYELVVDSAGNAYVAGISLGLQQDIMTIKFGPGGIEQWSSRYSGAGGAGDFPAALAVDLAGNVFVAGTAGGAGSQRDFVAIQYDPNGNQQWVTHYDNAGSSDELLDAAMGPGPSLYLTGNSYFDATGYDFLTLKYLPMPTSGRPQIVAPPQDQTVIVGGSPTNVEFSVTATGPGPLSYQWRHNGLPIPGATGPTLQINHVQESHGGGYSVIVSNAAGETVSPDAQLTVHVIPRIAYVFPTNETVVAGKSVFFYAGVTGDFPMTFQWQLNGADLPGQTNSQLQMNLLSTNASGLYRLLARNAFGEAISDPVRLTVLPATTIDRWTWRHPVPQGNDLRAITFGNGRFVAVGEGGTFLSSVDATNWSATFLDVGNLNDVAYGDGQFVAITFSHAYTSPDGLGWTERPIRGGSWSADVVSIAFGGGVYVAAGAGIYVSTNAIDWIRRTGDFQNFLRSVAYGNGRFVASANAFETYVSTNGWDWTSTNNLTFAIEDVAFGNGVFVGSYNNVFTVSPDGSQWTPHQILTNTMIYNLAFGNGLFLGLGQEIVTSPDGSNWTKRLNAPGAVLTDAAFGNGLTVVVGDGGNILTSSDAASWQWISRGTDNNLRGIVHAKNRFVTVGNDGVVWQSVDGRSWTNRVVLTTNNLRAIAFGHDRFVIAGSGGTLLSSSDASDWETHAIVTNDLYGLSFINGRFIAVGDQGRIVISTNGRDWLATSGGTQRRLQGITYGAGLYLATGQRGIRARSYDSTNWTASASEDLGYSEAVIYTNGLFVAVGSGPINTSGNGTNWTIRAYTPELESVIYVEGMFIAGGNRGAIFTSTNGVDWIRRGAPTTRSLRQLVYAQGSVWAVGNNEGILQSGQFRPYLMIDSAGPAGARLSVRAEPGQNLRIEASINLINWHVLTTQPVGPGDTLQHVDPTPDLRRRFYRADVR